MLFFLSILWACSHTHTVTTSDGSVTVDQSKDGGSMHVVGKDGAMADINTGKPITDYPADVPLYEGKSVMDIKSNEKHARVIALQTSDSLDEISDFYKSQLDSKGWKVETTMKTGEMSVFKANKDNRELVVSIGSEGGKQSISQTLTDK